MKREDIEKVAKDYSIGKTYFRRNVLKEVDADDYVLRKGNCSEDFIAGAEWRINSVWHSNNRTYKAQKPALVIFKNGKAKVYDNLTDLTIESLWGEIDRFAYIEDLIPNMEDSIMKPILNTEDIRKLKIDDKLIECSCGKVNYYRFLCFHPRNTNYVILLNHCEEPERFFIQNLIDRFYTNYTSRDIITYRRDYAIKKLKEFEQALSELGDKDEL